MEHCTPKTKSAASGATTGAGNANPGPTRIASSGISLPVLPGAHVTPRPSRMGWKRALVLLGVWVFMLAHIVQWLAMGSTLAPIEPSESMQTVKDGIITVGAIFFIVAIISTAILGRWFCGWGCHWVALQDGTSWLLRKAGVRPKPFRSRLLMWVPLLLALYMFIWPLFYRFAIAPWFQPKLTWPGFSQHYVVQDFWATFPGVMMTIPFTLVCGGVIIYLLGQKGYCTYACPYGGFFAPADELAPMRIIVDHDKCHQCGHCTAVCTSNVRVHEEVRDYGMVVDPGCMKCMDCVSVCPNDALSFGVGVPSLKVKREGTRAAEGVARRFDLSWAEEITLFVLAVLTFLAVRGSYLGLPLLFASGFSICVVFITWKAWRVIRDRNASFHQWQMRFHGAWRPAGAAWLGMTAALLLSVAYIGSLNGVLWAADRADSRVRIQPEMVYSDQRAELPPEMADDARAAIRLYRMASVLPEGYGVLPLAQNLVDLRTAWLDAALGNYESAEKTLRRMWDREGPSELVAAGIARVVRIQPDRTDEAVAWYDQQLAAHPDWQMMREEQLNWLQYTELYEPLLKSARDGLAAKPDNLLAMRRLSMALVEYGTTDEQTLEGVELIRKTLVIEPTNGFAFAAMGRGLLKLKRNAEAVAAFEQAVVLQPTSEMLRGMLEEARALGEQPVQP